MKAPTPERYAALGRWLAASRDRFKTEVDLLAAAKAEIEADGDELEHLANAWAKRAPIPSIDPETGELHEDDIPFELDDINQDAGELAIVETELVSMFGRHGPREAMALVEEYADTFKRFIVDHELTLEMEDGSHYVLAPGWEAGGQLNGVFTEIEWTQPVDGGWKARAYAHRPQTGERWSSREAVCMRSETGKRYKSDSDLIGQAQTRAARNALRASISIIVNAAGFDSAPPEERPASPKQRAALFALLNQLEQIEPRGKDGWKNQVTNWTITKFGVRISGLNRGQMGSVIDGMQQRLDQHGGEEYDSYDPSPEERAEAEGIEF